MAEGEFESQKALAAVIPDNTVIPMAWGLFQEDKSRAFFLTRFRYLRRPIAFNIAIPGDLEKASPDVTFTDGQIRIPCDSVQWPTQNGE